MIDLNIIAAYDMDKGIGEGGSLPWNLPSDLRRFQRMTTGCVVIMGRGTWDSLPKSKRPLPDRINVVITRDRDWKAEGTLVAHSLEQAIELTKNVAPLWVIGGQSIYEQALPMATRLHLTEVQCIFGCDRFFPDIDNSQWAVVKQRSSAIVTGDRYPTKTITLERVAETYPAETPLRLPRVRHRSRPVGV